MICDIKSCYADAKYKFVESDGEYIVLCENHRTIAMGEIKKLVKE